MYNNKRLAIGIFWLVLGIILVALSMVGKIDSSIFSGMGGGFVGVGAYQIVKNIKYRKNKEYKEAVDIAESDERNKYIRQCAWAYAGYLFVIICAVASIVCYVIGEVALTKCLSYGICLIVFLYWISYMIVARKN